MFNIFLQDILKAYRIGQHDASLRDILRASAKQIGIDLDTSFEEKARNREHLKQHAKMLIQQREME